MTRTFPDGAFPFEALLGTGPEPPDAGLSAAKSAPLRRTNQGCGATILENRQLTDTGSVADQEA